MPKCVHEQSHGAMDMFARILMSGTLPANYSKIAQYYENKGELIKVCVACVNACGTSVSRAL